MLVPARLGLARLVLGRRVSGAVLATLPVDQADWDDDHTIPVAGCKGSAGFVRQVAARTSPAAEHTPRAAEHMVPGTAHKVLAAVRRKSATVSMMLAAGTKTAADTLQVLQDKPRVLSNQKSESAQSRCKMVKLPSEIK